MQYTNLSFHKGSTTKDESNQNLLSVCLVFLYFWFFHEGKAYMIPFHSGAFAFSGATVMYQQHRIRVVRNHKKCCQCPRSAILIDAESQIGFAGIASKFLPSKRNCKVKRDPFCMHFISRSQKIFPFASKHKINKVLCLIIFFAS